MSSPLDTGRLPSLPRPSVKPDWFWGRLTQFEVRFHKVVKTYHNQPPTMPHPVNRPSSLQVVSENHPAGWLWPLE